MKKKIIVSKIILCISLMFICPVCNAQEDFWGNELKDGDNVEILRYEDGDNVKGEYYENENYIRLENGDIVEVDEYDIERE